MTARRQAAQAPEAEVKRCAIYTRKSTTAGLEQEFNSLDAQRESCELYIRGQAGRGWQLIPEAYDDGGFSGANIERPAFTRLMQDVEAGKIDAVVVYKVDRLSRSLLDFAKVMDRFNRAGAAFVSVTQNFSTADAMGRLTLNMLMSFAEFERSMIAERTRDKIAASRRKGKWTGGSTPLGYDVKDKHLVVNEVEAALVRRIYDLYLEKRSAGAVAKALNAEHRTTKHHVGSNGNSRGAREWDKNAVLMILRNPVQAGLMSCGSEVFEGEHQAVIDRKIFERVQHLLDEGCRPRAHWGRNPDYILTGLLRCGICGAALTPASTRKAGREYRYYRCLTRGKKGQEHCTAATLPAGAIEEFVIERIRDAIQGEDFAEDVVREARARLAAERATLQGERKDLPAKIASLSTEGKRLVESASRMTDNGRVLLDTKIEEVGGQLARFEARLAEVEHRLAMLVEDEMEVGWVVRCLADFDKIWGTLSPENRGRLVRALVDKVEIDEPSGNIRVFCGDVAPSLSGAAQVVEVAG